MMKMKKVISWLLCSALSISLLTGCGASNKATEGNSVQNDKTNATKELESEEVKETAEPVEVKIWHDGDESITAIIETELNQTLSEDNITVSFEKKSGLTDQLKLYGNDEKNGPDMYFYAHDSLGTFVEMGIVAPLKDVMDTGVPKDLLPMTVDAGAYKGEQYLLPIYFETLLFLYNKDLWEGEVPSTTEDLYTYMTTHTDAAAGTYAVVNQHSTAYNVAPFINGFGGFIINEEGQPGLNNQATKDAIIYNQKFAALQADGDYNTVNTLFNEGKAQAIIGGPWLISGIKEAGINLGIKSLSDFTLPNGNALAPYSGVQCVGVMKHAVPAKKDALAKVLEAIVGETVGVQLAKESNCAPANAMAYVNSDVASNEMIVAIKDTAETAKPMPNIPQMSVMWQPSESLLAAINKSGSDINTSADQYQKEAEKSISDMQ